MTGSDADTTIVKLISGVDYSCAGSTDRLISLQINSLNMPTLNYSEDSLSSASITSQKNYFFASDHMLKDKLEQKIIWMDKNEEKRLQSLSLSGLSVETDSTQTDST